MRTGADPSLEQLVATLTGDSDSKFFKVISVISDEIVKIPSIDGISVGSKVKLGDSVKGVVLQFDPHSATVAMYGTNRGIISRESKVSLLASDAPMKFKKKGLKLNSPRARAPRCEQTIPSSVPVVDMLFGPFMHRGLTVGVYSGSFKPDSESLKNDGAMVMKFPSKSNESAFEMYIDLFNVANKAMEETCINGKKFVHLIVDFREFESAMKSLEFQANHSLPVSPQSLVASVLQLSHAFMTVTGIFNSKTDFCGEASQSVDFPVELGASGDLINLHALLQRFALVKKIDADPLKALRDRLLRGFELSWDLESRKQAGIYVDFWEQEDNDSFQTLLKLLSPVAKAYAKSNSELERTILLRALTVLHFNKTTPRRYESSIDRFPHQLLESFRFKEGLDPKNILEIDYALMKHRFEWELTKEQLG